MQESKLLYMRKTWHQAYGWGFRLEIILQQPMLQFWVYLRGDGLAHNNGILEDGTQYLLLVSQLVKS